MEIKELIRFVKQYRKLIDRASYVSIGRFPSETRRGNCALFYPL